MLLNEILDRLTPRENTRANNTGSQTNLEYHLETL